MLFVFGTMLQPIISTILSVYRNSKGSFLVTLPILHAKLLMHSKLSSSIVCLIYC